MPGLCLGLMIALVINIGMREAIFIESKNWLSYDLTKQALVLGAVCGFVVPMLANYLPIRSALNKTLRNSLDLNKRTDDKIGIKM